MSFNISQFPWIDRQEVTNVFNGLYSADIELQMYAIDRVKVWEARLFSRLPIAAEATIAFVKANIEYEKAKKPIGNDVRIREMYSFAIIRFVNLFTERNQDKAHALPVHVIASRLGVPSWIVDLRHSSTHVSLPSLNQLRAASQWCLEWLRTEFWEVQCTDINAVEGFKRNASKITKDLLVSFMQEQFEGISSGDYEVSKVNLFTLENALAGLGDKSCAIVLEDGYFVLTEEQLASLDLSTEDILDNKAKELPQKVTDFWKPVLILLAKVKLLANVLIHLVTLLGQCSHYRDIYLRRWLISILSNIDTWFDKKVDTEIPYRTILSLYLQSNTIESDPCVEALIRKARLPQRTKNRLLNLGSLMKKGDKNAEVDDKFYSIGDINLKRTEDSNCWRRCTDKVNWANIPLGRLPDQQVDYTSLKIGATSQDIGTLDSHVYFANEPEGEDNSCEINENNLLGITVSSCWNVDDVNNVAENSMMF